MFPCTVPHSHTFQSSRSLNMLIFNSRSSSYFLSVYSTLAIERQEGFLVSLLSILPDVQPIQSIIDIIFRCPNHLCILHYFTTTPQLLPSFSCREFYVYYACIFIIHNIHSLHNTALSQVIYSSS